MTKSLQTQLGLQESRFDSRQYLQTFFNKQWCLLQEILSYFQTFNDAKHGVIYLYIEKLADQWGFNPSTRFYYFTTTLWQNRQAVQPHNFPNVLAKSNYYRSVYEKVWIL